jgi:hypothetical protein
MTASRSKRIMWKLSRAIIMAMAIALWDVSASNDRSAVADEFLLVDTNGEPLREARVVIETEQERSITYTDQLGRLVVPYRGRQVTYWAVREGKRAELRIDGDRQLKTVTME